MKRIKMLAVFLMVVFMLTACGSSSGGSTGGNVYSKTYTKTGDHYYDDGGNRFDENWTNKTTVTISGDKTQVKIFQEETWDGGHAAIYETVYTFSKPIINAYFVENYSDIDPCGNESSYGMSIVATGGTTVTTKMGIAQKANWTEASVRNVQIWVDTGKGDGEFYNSYYLTSGNQYHVFPEHYDPEFATVVTYIDVK